MKDCSMSCGQMDQIHSGFSPALGSSILLTGDSVLRCQRGGDFFCWDAIKIQDANRFTAWLSIDEAPTDIWAMLI